ncbi:MAG: hypothetical protein ACK55I_27470, partial [bacterium]
GEDVQRGAVAGHVLDPLVPELLVAALQVDALAEDRARGLGRQALQEGGQRGVEDAAVVGFGVLAGFLGDVGGAVGAECGGAADAEVDGGPVGLHRLDELGALRGVGVVDARR